MKKLLILISLILILNISLQQIRDEMIVYLDRKVEDRFQEYDKIKKGEYKDAICNKIEDKNQSFKGKMENVHKCSDEMAFDRLKTNCINENVYYTTKVAFGTDTSNYFDLAVDLTVPWTWVKDDECATYDREGNHIIKGCEYNDHDKQFKFNEKKGHLEIEKCAEIDYKDNGLSVVGQFVQSTVEFKDFNSETMPITYKFIKAYGLAGQQQLEADGVLGLGRPHSNISVENISKLKKDDFSEYYSDEKENQEDYSKDLNPYNIETFDYEPESGLVDVLKFHKNVSADQNIFSIYLADNIEENFDRDYKSHIHFFGMNPDKYVHNYSHNPMQYVNLQRERYFLWQVEITELSIFEGAGAIKYQDIMKAPHKFSKEIIHQFQNPGIFSLTTKSLALPKNQIKKLIEILQKSHEIECFSDYKYQYNLYCKGMTELDLINLYIRITLSDDKHILLNPRDLVDKQDCLYNKKDEHYECVLNIQQSYNDHTILGEAVMKNYYWVFDVNENKIGFAPAKNKYNEQVFQVIKQEVQKKYEKIVQEVETDVEFIVRFSAVIIMVIIAGFSFRNVDTISGWVLSILGRQSNGVRINPVDQDFDNLENVNRQQQNFDYKQNVVQRKGLLDNSQSSFVNINSNRNQFQEFDSQEMQTVSSRDSARSNPFDSDDDDDEMGGQQQDNLIDLSQEGI